MHGRAAGLLLSGLLLLPAAGAAPARDSTVQKFLEHSDGQDASPYVRETWNYEEVLYDWAKQGADRQSLEQRSMSRYGMPAAMATRLVALTLERGGNGSKSTPEINQKFLVLARDFPGQEIAFKEAARAIDDGAWTCEPHSYHALIDAHADRQAARRLVFDTVGCLGVLT